MKAIGKNIVVKNIEEEIETDSGLLLSHEDTKGLRYQKAEVLEPGSDVTVIKKGDTIYFDKRQSYTMIISGEKVTITQERDVVVVL